MTTPTLWLVDGSHAVYRAFHAIRPKDPKDILRTPQGVPSNAVHVFTSMLLRAIREHRPTHLVVTFDEDAEASRKAIYADYKATRADTPDDLRPQFPMVRQVLEALEVPALAFRGYEADDIIATLTKRGHAQGMDVVILTGDKDLLQLVEQEEGKPKVRCYDSMNEKWYGPAEVEEKWGVPPRLVADLLALTGDAIDNVPGVPGVGQKTAAALLLEHGSLEAVLQHAAQVKKPKLRENLLASLETVRRGRQLIGLFDDLPLPVGPAELARRPFDEKRVRALFKELGFSRLLSQLPKPDPKPPACAHRVIGSAAELEALLAEARAAGRFTLYTVTSEGEPLRDQLVGLALALAPVGDQPAQAAYLPLGHRVHGTPEGAGSGDLFTPAKAQLTADQATRLLRPLFEDAAVTKDGHDLKRDVEAWARRGVVLRGTGTDARLASYLLDSSREHGLAEAALDRAALLLPDLKALQDRTGKGKKSTPLAELPVADLGEAACLLATGACRLAALLEEELRGEPALYTLYTELERPLLELLTRLELRGICLDVEKLRALSADLGGQIEALLHEIHQLAGGEFSPASNQQLAEVLFGKLQLPVLKKTKTGPSTDQEVLEKLAEQHPLPAKILEHRQLTKLKGTYLDALPAALGADGRLHTTFDQAVAATGRLSSINPNLQNIPIRTPLGARIREAFVAQPGWLLVSADYSQIELRVLAHVSGDPVLRSSFESGEDLHARTAGETFGVAPAEVTRHQRDIAKMINYGIAYGLSAYGLATRLGLPGAEAQGIIDRYFARYAGVKTWLDGVVEEARREGVVSTLFGRRRPIPDLHSSNPALRMAAERAAVNTPIQGTAADLVKRAMLRVDERLRRESLQAAMLLQIHDELLLEAPPDESDRVAQLVREEMERAATLAVPLVVEVGIGPTWGAAHG